MSVKIEHSVNAKCKPEHAWQKFQKLEEWPWWNRVIGQAKWVDSSSAWKPGSRFVLEIAYPKRLSMKPAITENSAPRAVAWNSEGNSMHFRFEPQADGTTLLAVVAEFSGFKTVFGGGSLRDSMQQALHEWLSALKSEAEIIAREEFARS